MFRPILNWLGMRKKDASFEEVIAAISAETVGAKGGWSKRSYRGYAHEAYEKNVVAYSCIANISKAVANVPIIIKSGDKEITSGKVYDLINRPNPCQSYKTFMRMAVMYRLISGNTYIHALRVYTKRIMQMELLRPDRVQILTVNEEPYAYQYNIAGQCFKYEIDPVTGLSEVLHIKEPNPICDLYGMSPISAAIMAIEQHNQSVEWNKTLLQNSARPPGVFSIVNRNDGAPPPDQKTLDDIRDRLNEKYAGYKNAGKIPVVGFDMRWENLGMSPTDMDWLNGKNSSARDVCLALNYPAYLLGQAEGATFNNMAEAKLALYEDNIIPMCESMYSELAYYLKNMSGEDITIVPDIDRVSALMPRREAARNNARLDLAAGVITTNEAREEGNYDPVVGGDELLVPAGKLPLNFDVGDMTAPKYNTWLLNQGMSKDMADELTKLAFTKP
jgi:HK97 family phage portal protein